MYFAVAHIIFESDDTRDGGEMSTKGREQELKRLAEKIRSRFKICAAATFVNKSLSPQGIAVTALGTSEEKLSKLLDSVVDFCEQSGFGRVLDEQAIVEHLDFLSET